MFKYVLKRVALMIMTLFIIISMCFIFVKLLPNEVPKVFGKDMEIIMARREALGYNKPLLEQYLIFIQKTLLGGDWGVSETMYPAREVWPIFVSKFPPTIALNVFTMIVSIPIGLIFGIYAALKKNKWQDHVISTGVMVFVSVPSYVYAFLVQYILCFKLKWFPFTMAPGETMADMFTFEVIFSLIPAVLASSFGTIAGLARYTRAELTEVLTSDYLLLARTKGLTKSQTTVRHALRNAMVPIFPSILGQFIGILSGSLIIENIFVIPGVGSLYIDSINRLDYNFFMLLTVFYTAIGLVAGIVVDLSYGFIDPRIRMGSKK
ncbi:MAG: ABC transporter permease [Clostridia bacterium]|nr:ABC transporter permease [Clostridia bacterium]